MTVTSGIQSVDKVPALVRASFTLDGKIQFPAGGLADQKPLINLALTKYPATERIDMYLDLGATDPAKDLDVVTSATMKPIYQDPCFVDNNLETGGVLPPKIVVIRCLLGSGLVYLNALPQLLSSTKIYQVPFVLHENAGVFYYACPKQIAHYSKAVNPAVPTDIFTTSISLLSIHLRTFEDSNRFQLVIFK